MRLLSMFQAQILRPGSTSIMVNQFITNVRRQHKCNDIDQIPEVGMRGAQEDQTDLRELNLAFSAPTGGSKGCTSFDRG